ncbi:MAG: hypothetical protein ABIS27_11080 [Longimicrobiales bacterium]
MRVSSGMENMHPEDGRGVGRYRAMVLLLALYTAVFAALSFDLMTRIWEWRERLAPRDLAALSFFEISRSVVTLGAIALLVAMAAWRTDRRWRPLAIGIGFAAVWHAKAFGFAAFPGPRQEAVALWLRGHHVPHQLLTFVFAAPAWTLACAAAAALRFAVGFPVPLRPDAVDLPATADRAGLMRSAGVAGADIGAYFRESTRNLLLRGWLRTTPIVVQTLLWIVLYELTGGSIFLLVPGVFLLAGAAGIVVTALRATTIAADNAAARHSIRWLARSLYSGAALFAASAAASALFTGAASFVGVSLLGIAPAATLVCCWIAIMSPRARAPLPVSQLP